MRDSFKIAGPKAGSRYLTAEQLAGPDTSRTQARRMRHTRRWYELSARFLGAHPMCMHDACREGAVETHHIVPVASDPRRAFDWSNLRALCKRHHREEERHAEQQQGRA